jgi:uncharacterized protein (DUF1778 family)
MTRTDDDNPISPEAPQDMGDDDTIHLTRRESLRLLELIENPPPRNERFRQAMERYRRLTDAAES